MSFVEIENLGPNLSTASLVILTLINLWQFCEYIRQGLDILRARSTDAVSPVFALFLPGILAGVLWYGFIDGVLVLVMAGACFLPASIVAYGALRYGKLTWKEWFVFLGASAMPFAFLLPIPPDLVFITLATATVIPMTTQLMELGRAADQGVASGKLLLTYLVKNSSYVIFGFAAGKLVVGFCAIGWTLLSLWVYLRWRSLPKVR